MSISELVGKTLTKIDIGPDSITFHTRKGPNDDYYKSGPTYTMNHSQDCCELVYIEDITGDILDLLETPILTAYEETSDVNPPNVNKESQDHFTWTFYRIGTIKGTVTIRWYGESNGYYSESVDFWETDKGD